MDQTSSHIHVEIGHQAVLTLTAAQPVYYLFIEQYGRANNPHGFLYCPCANFLEDTDYIFFQRLPTKIVYLNASTLCKPFINNNYLD